MSTTTTVFYWKKTEVSVDFSANATSSDGAVFLLEKLERCHQLIHYMSQAIPDERDP